MLGDILQNSVFELLLLELLELFFGVETAFVISWSLRGQLAPAVLGLALPSRPAAGEGFSVRRGQAFLCSELEDPLQVDLQHPDALLVWVDGLDTDVLVRLLRLQAFYTDSPCRLTLNLIVFVRRLLCTRSLVSFCLCIGYGREC